jgi:hypothetical protein
MFRVPYIGKLLRLIFKIPLVAEELKFDATLDSKSSVYPDFIGLPRLTFTLERFNEKSNSYDALPSVDKNQIDGVAAGDKVIYPLSYAAVSLDPGKYRYSYQLTGETRTTGTFSIKSSRYHLEIISFVLEFWVAVIVLIMISMFFISIRSNRRAILSGIIETKGAGKKTKEKLDQKTYMSQGQNRFMLEAKKVFLKKRINMTITKGKLKVNGQNRSSGYKGKLVPGRPHKIHSTEDGNRIKMTLRVNVVGHKK